MINKEALDREIANITKIMTQVELASISESNEFTKNGLKSALGQLKTARTWLIKIKEKDGLQGT